MIGSESGHLDALVNNAGVYGDPVGAADYDLDRAHEVLEVNTFGPWRLIEAFLPLLHRSDAPRIVNVSSGAGPALRHERRPRRLSSLEGGSQRAHPHARVGRGRHEGQRDVPGLGPDRHGRVGRTKSVEEGADTAVWLATLPDDGPTGGFFRDRKPIPW